MTRTGVPNWLRSPGAGQRGRAQRKQTDVVHISQCRDEMVGGGGGGPSSRQVDLAPMRNFA